MPDSLLDHLMDRRSSVIHGDDDTGRAAVAAIFRVTEDQPQLLLIQRAVHANDPWSGQIGFPGGRHERGDPTLQATAERETHEEIGLSLQGDRASCLGPLDDLQARARARILPLVIRPFAFVLVGEGETQFRLNEEVDSAFWVPLDQLADPKRRIWHDAHRSTLPFSFPAVDLGQDRILWGLTHHMTMGILERLGRVEDATALCIPRPRQE
ncbi:MAG TPA: CoA pyrophosphatase [Deltaproteobacteria bacterium]|nr:coenzyme A pyrophosphatase [Deltaproteobacteria bacterium]HCP47300.1 CoA pyrophosphatase [Deltaproteobacteria bacterium]